MGTHTFLLVLCGMFVSTSAWAGPVSSSSQTCIIGALKAGSVAINNRTRLASLYELYFAKEAIAKKSAGGLRWKRMSPMERNAQLKRVQNFDAGPMARRFASYAGSKVLFIDESEGQVRGVVIKKDGERVTVIWHMGGGCTFVDISIPGTGPMTAFIGREIKQKESK